MLGKFSNFCLGLEKNHQKCGHDNIFFFLFGSSHPFIFEFMHPINSLNLASVKKSPTNPNIVNFINFISPNVITLVRYLETIFQF